MTLRLLVPRQFDLGFLCRSDELGLSLGHIGLDSLLSWVNVPATPSPSIPIPNPLFYCSAALSPLHHSSAETHLPSSAHSSHLRAALRLLRSHRPSPSPSLRLAGLISNRRILTSHPHNHVSERISLGATAMAEAIAKQRAVPNDDAVLEEATIALCAVITNAVEMGSGGVCVSSDEFDKEVLGYGPRLVVRSIKKIKKGEEVTVAYTDILQSKAMRQWELWPKYRFVCCCKRSSDLPLSYVDHALQGREVPRLTDMIGGHWTA
ncbi:hypothetical protein VNO80_13172 [Phaseolus coccineus]|uniref:SET domain-containing protein n=1 Tax=Phaseolus coccineus TaxID=3886 RepID=A0AAN9N693_PHACN